MVRETQDQEGKRIDYLFLLYSDEPNYEIKKKLTTIQASDLLDILSS